MAKVEAIIILLVTVTARQRATVTIIPPVTVTPKQLASAAAKLLAKVKFEQAQDLLSLAEVEVESILQAMVEVGSKVRPMVTVITMV